MNSPEGSMHEMTIDRGNHLRVGRLLIAGLVAGLIMNIGEAALHAGILADATTAAYSALNRTIVADPMNLVSLVVLTFAQGIVMTWLYAVVGPRFGTRSTAAACVGLIAWFLSSLYAAVYLHSGLPGILPTNVVWPPVAWELIEFPLAAFAGAITYGKS
jgi:hypothetical protein